MHEFLVVLLSSFEILGLNVPLLWIIAAGVLAVAFMLRAWSSVGVAVLLAGLSYLEPFVKP